MSTATSNPTRSSTKGHSSVVHIEDDWYIICRSGYLTGKPRSIELMGTPLVIFRAKNGQAGALLDRCPHRNAPLSLGTVRGDVLQCAYHGWRFDVSGTCRYVAGAGSDHIMKACHATAYPVREQQGFVWVFGTPRVEPDREPFLFPFVSEPGYTTVCRELQVEASLHAVAENALDVPHTAYLHGGLFRSTNKQTREIEVVISRYGDRVEAEYVGESAPTGLAGRILAPRGGPVSHVDRFILPSITQVEYKIGSETHLCVTVALTPVYDFITKLFAAVSFRLPIPGWMVVPVLRPLFLRIFEQDAEILKRQTETIKRFGGEQFASTSADILGPHIYRLLKMAERGERSRSEKNPQIFKTQLLV